MSLLSPNGESCGIRTLLTYHVEFDNVESKPGTGPENCGTCHGVGFGAGYLMEHGRLRAEAMTIRDTKAEDGGVSEEDWARINELLRQSWRSLASAVKTSS